MNKKAPIQGNVKAIVWIVVILLIAGGYYFLKDSKALAKRQDYFAYFADIQGLQPSSPVMMKGVRVGKISDIDLTGGNVKITLSVNKEIPLPVGTVAKLASGGITGEKMIDLQPGIGPAVLNANSTLTTAIDSSLLPVSVRFTPIFEATKFILRSTDSALRATNILFRANVLGRTALGVVNLEQKMQGMSDLSAELNNEYNVQAIVTNANAQTQQLVTKEGNFNKSVNSAVKNSEKLAKSRLADDVVKLQSSMKSIGNSFRKLDTSTSGIGKMLNDKSSYQSTVNSFDTLNRNWKQLQKDPPGISIFGKKKK